MNIKELEDKADLRELFDRISILGDKKDFKNQVQLFTENAVSETSAGGSIILKLQGREALAEAFAKFLESFETVYHFNGQQVVSINGDEANGTCYCMVTLIANEGGRKIMNTIGTIYEDEYVRSDRGWLIAKRAGTFDWQERREVIK